MSLVPIADPSGGGIVRYDQDTWLYTKLCAMEGERAIGLDLSAVFVRVCASLWV